MPSPQKSTNHLRYHREKNLRLRNAPIPPLNNVSKQCLRNLIAYRFPRDHPGHSIRIPKSRSAAVLVALFVGRHGDLYVLLSKRSETLRSYAGDTSLPGGKTDPEDRTAEDTARREAFEEASPATEPASPSSASSPPFLASNSTLVTPVVVLILDNTLQPILNTSEVTTLFSHPLFGFLGTTSPFRGEPEFEEVEYHTYGDWEWKGRGSGEGFVRAHRFLTGREAGGIKPVFGLTAAICIETASIGYAQPPLFELHPPGGPSMKKRIAWVLLYDPKWKEAFEKEGIKVDEAVLKKLLDGESKKGKRKAKL